MLRFLGKLLGRDLTNSSEPIDANVPDDEIWEMLHPAGKMGLSRKRKGLCRFVQFATRHLSKAESQRLSHVAKQAFSETGDVIDALLEVMSSENGQQRGQWVFIQLDCKATEEIFWQVAEILSARGIDDYWARDCEAEFHSVPEALHALSEWLAARKLALLHIETNSDGYGSFIVKASDVGVARSLAKAITIELYDRIGLQV